MIERIMYHTQEKWNVQLSEAQKCDKSNAWLGSAWYFWYDYDDAVYWGMVSKKRTNYFEIYTANIDCSNILDTVFNENDYLFWIKQIKKAAIRFAKIGKTPTIKLINDFFIAEKKWDGFNGIMFQDISQNPSSYIVKEFQYKKRIQLAVYNYGIVTNFTLDYEGKCV